MNAIYTPNTTTIYQSTAPDFHVMLQKRVNQNSPNNIQSLKEPGAYLIQCWKLNMND